MKKGKFLFIENTKDEKAEYQIFVLYPEKTKSDQVDEIYEKICQAIGNVKTRVFANRLDNNQEYDEEQQRKLLKQEMIYLPKETYVIINKFIIK